MYRCLPAWLQQGSEICIQHFRTGQPYDERARGRTCRGCEKSTGRIIKRTGVLSTKLNFLQNMYKKKIDGHTIFEEQRKYTL